MEVWQLATVLPKGERLELRVALAVRVCRFVTCEVVCTTVLLTRLKLNHPRLDWTQAGCMFYVVKLQCLSQACLGAVQQYVLCVCLGSCLPPWVSQFDPDTGGCVEHLSRTARADTDGCRRLALPVLPLPSSSTQY